MGLYFPNIPVEYIKSLNAFVGISMGQKAQKYPLSLLIFSIVFLIIGWVFSEELCLKLGLLRQSLLHENPSVRSIALHTISFLKMSMFILSGLLFVLFFSWPKLSHLKLIQNIYQHKPFYPKPDFSLHGVFNPSLLILGSAILLTLLYTVFGKQVFSDSLNQWITKEDGLMEWGSALMFLLASLFAAMAAYHSPKTSYRITLSIFAFLFFACFGEEISWGQRIFDLKTPESLEKVNIQGEINIHNSVGYLADHLFILSLFLYGFAAPLLSACSPFFRNVFDKMGIPIASSGLALSFLFISLMHDWTVYRVISPWELRVAELREMLSAFGLLLLMFEANCYLGNQKK